MKLNKSILPVVALIGLIALSNVALAQEGAGSPNGTIALASALAIGLAVLGGGYGQGTAAASMYEAVARNPQAADKLNTPFILGLAFIESLVLFGFAIAFLLQGKF